LPAYQNLSSAYLARDHNIYKTIGFLLDATEKFDDPQLLNNLGIAFFISGDTSKAMQYLQQSINQFHSTTGYYNLGIIEDLSKHPSKAKANWRQYNSLAPNSVYKTLLNDYSINGRITLLVAGADFHGSTLKHIKIGDPVSKLDKRYGDTALIYQTPSGEIRNYDNEHIAFDITNNAANGWTVY